MSKALSIGGMVVAGLLAVAFGMDLVLGFPFDRANSTMNIGLLVASLTLGYLSFDALRSAS